MTYVNKTTNVLVKFPIKNQRLITTIITNINILKINWKSWHYIAMNINSKI